MTITVNGKETTLPDDASLLDLLKAMDVRMERVAVERNRRVVPRAEMGACRLESGDELEIVTLVGGGAAANTQETLDKPLVIGKYTFRSRLFVGTGKYSSFDLMRECLDASGTECVTVAVRRVNLAERGASSLLDYIDTSRITILPNTAGCFSAEDAVRYARLSREVLGTDLVKLEVLADEKTLLPHPVQTLSAANTLIQEGFTVLCYTSDDPVLARELEQIGCASVMPAGSPIGSGQGVLNPNNIRIILEQAKVPIICDAGVGTASDVSIAMELGCEGVLLNTGVAHAQDPMRMAHAMKHACIAGRLAHLAGRIPRRLYATASSPMEGRISSAS